MVEGYIAVACFLMREGADWLVKNKEVVSPHQALPPAAAALISEYLKKLLSSYSCVHQFCLFLCLYCRQS